MKRIPARERLIFALDVGEVGQARALVERLGDSVTFYKVGHVECEDQPLARRDAVHGAPIVTAHAPGALGSYRRACSTMAKRSVMPAM